MAVVGVSTNQSKFASIVFQNLLCNRMKGILAAPVYAIDPIIASEADIMVVDAGAIAGPKGTSLS